MTLAEEANFRNTLRQLLDHLTTYKAEILLRADKEVNFVQAEPLFRRVTNFIELLKGVSWDAVPTAYIQFLINTIQRLRPRYDTIKDFSGTQGEPLRNRDAAVNQLETEFNQVYNEVVPHLSFAMVTGTNVMDNLRAQWNEALAKSIHASEESLVSVSAKRAQLDAALSDIQQKQAKVSDILQQVQKDALQKGVTDQASHFAKLADTDFRASVAWLSGAVILAIVILIYLSKVSSSLSSQISSTRDEFSKTNLLVSTSQNSTNLTQALVKQTGTNSIAGPQPTPIRPPSDIFALLVVVTPRVVILTVLLTALVFCLRNFAAVSHNRVVNRHRQTALTTFEVFVKSANDDATKNAVLIQATQAIFAPQPSGYLKNDNEVSQLPQVSLITDLVRGGGRPDKS